MGTASGPSWGCVVCVCVKRVLSILKDWYRFVAIVPHSAVPCEHPLSSLSVFALFVALVFGVISLPKPVLLAHKVKRCSEGASCYSESIFLPLLGVFLGTFSRV